MDGEDEKIGPRRKEEGREGGREGGKRDIPRDIAAPSPSCPEKAPNWCPA